MADSDADLRLARFDVCTDKGCTESWVDLCSIPPEKSSAESVWSPSAAPLRAPLPQPAGPPGRPQLRLIPSPEPGAPPEALPTSAIIALIGLLLLDKKGQIRSPLHPEV